MKMDTNLVSLLHAVMVWVSMSGCQYRFFPPPAMHCVDSNAEGDVGIRDQGSKVSVTSRLSI